MVKQYGIKNRTSDPRHIIIIKPAIEIGARSFPNQESRYGRNK
jgi:hypothetical protein